MKLLCWIGLLSLSTGAVAQPVVSLSFANLRAVIRPAQGGRLASLALNGQEALTTPDSPAGQFIWGNSFWTAPQSVWNWPPPAAHDAAPYHVVARAAHYVRLEGPPDTLTGFRLTKEYRINPADTSLTVACTYTNVVNVVKSVAPWEISRSPKGGVALLPVASVRRDMNFSLKPRVTTGNVHWYAMPDEPLASGRGEKLNLDATGGWLAYARHDLLLLKRYPDVVAAELCPNEGDAELYVSPRYNYVELEETGPYRRVPPGASVRLETRWLLRRLPTPLRSAPGPDPTEPGAVALLRLVQRLVAD